MATPEMQIQGFNVALVYNSPGSLDVLTKNPDGSDLDVSTGYTVQDFAAVPIAGANFIPPPVILSSFVSAAFTTTGVNLSWTAAQSVSMVNALQAQNNVALLRLTNDAGTTQSVVAEGTLAIDVNSTYM